MHKLLQFFAFFLLFTFSIFATPIHYAPIMMGDIISFVPYSHVSISLGNDIVLEGNQTTLLSVKASNPNDIVSYEWKEGNKVLGTSSTLSTSVFTFGRHTLTLSVVDNNGLSTSDTIVITIYKENNPPVIIADFPKTIFTDSNMSDVNITINDPDQNDTVNTIYEWKVNNIVVSHDKVLDNQLFKKHDILTLQIISTDNREGNPKSSTKTLTQEVLNSRPIIDVSFNHLDLTIGDRHSLIYTIIDADNDDVDINWVHYYNPWVEEEWVASLNCQTAIEEYDITHPNTLYRDMTNYEKEDFNYKYCTPSIYGEVLSMNFIEDDVYKALLSGHFIHKMIVSDGESNRTALLDVNVSNTDIVDVMVNNHDQYNTNKPYNVYMKDFNNDGYDDLVYMTYVIKQSNDGPEGEPIVESEVPQLVVELRNGLNILSRTLYDINCTNLEDFYVNDFNGDGKLDIILTHSNHYSPPTNKRFSVMYQNNDGFLGNENDINLSNYTSMTIGNVLDGESDEIILATTDGWNDTGIKIYGVDGNKTIEHTLPNILNHYGVARKIIVRDLDMNGKNDIVLINKTFRDENNTLTFSCSVLYQNSNGEFNEHKYEKNLAINLTQFNNIKDALITDLIGEENVFVVSTNDNIYFLKIIDNNMEIIKRLDYFNRINNDRNKHMNAQLIIEDINHDMKKDILLLDTSYTIDKFLNVFIQSNNNDFLMEQSYSLSNYYNDTPAPKFTFGDIDNDNNYEIFLSTGDNNLSTIYFK